MFPERVVSLQQLVLSVSLFLSYSYSGSGQKKSRNKQADRNGAPSPNLLPEATASPGLMDGPPQHVVIKKGNYSQDLHNWRGRES